jgi:hypothetical protein
MLGHHCSHKQTCSVVDLLRENDLVRVVVDGLPWKSRVEDASQADVGLIDIAAPLPSVFAGQFNEVSTVEVLVSREQALFVLQATVVCVGACRIDTISLRIDSIQAIQRRSTPRLKTILDVCIRKVGSKEWECSKSVNIGIGGLLVTSIKCCNTQPDEILEVSIAQHGSSPILFTTRVIECVDVAQKHLMRLAVDSIDNENRLALYRLVQSKLE